MNRARVATWLLVLAVVVALTLRLVALGRKSLWLDEAVTLRIAAGDVSDIVSARGDPHPPLYYLLMHYWTGLGQSEFVARLPSALAGAAAIPLLYWLVREWKSQWSAIASAWFLAVAPLHVWYSQEARMYALVCTLGLASTLAYAVAVRRGSLLAWVVWSLVTVTGLYTQYSMLLIVFAQVALFGLLRRRSSARQGTLWPALLALLAVSILFLPQARIFVKQLVLSGGHGGPWYYRSLQLLLAEWGIAISLTQVYTAVISIGVIALTAAGIAAWTLRSRIGWLRASAGLTVAAVAAYLLILIASAVPRGLGLKRQGLILLPYVLAGIVAAISGYRYRTHLLVGLVAVTLPLTGYVVMAQEQEPWRDVARYLEQQAEPQDIIMVSAPYMQEPLGYYYHGEAQCAGVGPADVPEKLLEITASPGRPWLVLRGQEYTDPQGKVPRWLDENCTLLDERTFDGKVHVRLYDRACPQIHDPVTD